MSSKCLRPVQNRDGCSRTCPWQMQLPGLRPWNLPGCHKPTWASADSHISLTAPFSQSRCSTLLLLRATQLQVGTPLTPWRSSAPPARAHQVHLHRCRCRRRSAAPGDPPAMRPELSGTILLGGGALACRCQEPRETPDVAGDPTASPRPFQSEG